jgi:hypothetical protein
MECIPYLGCRARQPQALVGRRVQRFPARDPYGERTKGWAKRFCNDWFFHEPWVNEDVAARTKALINGCGRPGRDRS